AKPWRGTWAGSGGGLLINQAIHTLDLVQWLVGPVERTEGHVSTRRFGDVIEVEDTADLLLHHAGGVTTSFYATLTAPRNRPVEIELDCENAYVELRGGLNGGLTIRWADGRVDRYGDRVTASNGRAYWGVSHELLIQDFYADLDRPAPFWIGPQEAMASLRLLKDAYRASGAGPGDGGRLGGPGLGRGGAGGGVAVLGRGQGWAVVGRGKAGLCGGGAGLGGGAAGRGLAVLRRGKAGPCCGGARLGRAAAGQGWAVLRRGKAGPGWGRKWTEERRCGSMARTEAPQAIFPGPARGPRRAPKPP